MLRDAEKYSEDHEAKLNKKSNLKYVHRCLPRPYPGTKVWDNLLVMINASKGLKDIAKAGGKKLKTYKTPHIDPYAMLNGPLITMKAQKLL